jgi:hypothetical protein
MSDKKMTDIELAKECLSTYETQGYFPHGEIYSFPKLLSSLITTIESQKEEIEKLKGWVYKLQDAHQIEQFNLNAEIESLKAITELAVKGLKWYADTDNHDNGYTRYDEDGEVKGVETFVEEDYGQLARNTLSEIKRLQNAQT